MNLYQDFKTHTGKRMSKWNHYFPIYERFFNPMRNKSLLILEIGVSGGGSLQMWQRYFGPLSTIIGIDIDAECINHQSDGIHVRIGDQSDHSFLLSIINEFGIPDIIIDDGSHRMDHIISSFEFLYPKISKNGIYLIEDLHTSYWAEFGGGVNNINSFINISKSFIDQLNARHSRGDIIPNFITDHTFGISFFDSMIVFERGTVPLKIPIHSGV